MKSIAYARAALPWESTVHARAALQHTSSTKLMSFVIMALRRERKSS